jgi:hypothetical protein
VAAAVAEQICTDPDLPLLGVGQLARRAERAAILVDPAAAQARRHAAAAGADVSMCPHPDGMAGLALYGPAEDVAAAMSSIAAAAAAEARAAGADDATPIGVRRFRTAIAWLTTPRLPAQRPGPTPAPTPAEDGAGADTAAGAAFGGGFCDDPARDDPARDWPAGDDPADADAGALGGAQPGPPAGAGAARVVLHVTVPVTTLAGVSDAPGDLAGYGPIPAVVARGLAARAPIWWRLLTDPATGALCPTPPTGYRIPDPVRRYVQTRDTTCAHPGCDRPAVACDLDHADDWPAGPTCPCNLSPRCRRHHNCKTRGAWTVTTARDGRHTTTSPTGRTYPTVPDPPPGELPAETTHRMQAHEAALIGLDYQDPDPDNPRWDTAHDDAA